MTLLLIDGNNLLHRILHALGAFDGRFTGGHAGVFGVIKTLRSLLSLLQPGSLLVTWDGGVSARRRIVWPDYKRRTRPTAVGHFLETQRQEVSAALDALGIAQWGPFPNTEADDLLAYAARIGAQQGYRSIWIYTNDRDLLQCLQPGVAVWRDQGPMVTLVSFPAVLRVPFGAHRWLPYRCITGDASDGIPGVHGAGPKVATVVVTAMRGPTSAAEIVRAAESLPRSSRVTKILGEVPTLARNLALMDLSLARPTPEWKEPTLVPFAPLRWRDLCLDWGLRTFLAGGEEWLEPFARLPKPCSLPANRRDGLAYQEREGKKVAG